MMDCLASCVQRQLIIAEPVWNGRLYQTTNAFALYAVRPRDREWARCMHAFPLRVYVT
jgi:hypothetical protein